MHSTSLAAGRLDYMIIMTIDSAKIAVVVYDK